MLACYPFLLAVTYQYDDAKVKIQRDLNFISLSALAGVGLCSRECNSHKHCSSTCLAMMSALHPWYGQLIPWVLEYSETLDG